MKFVLDTSFITTPGSDLSILRNEIFVVTEVNQELKKTLSEEQLRKYSHFKIKSPDFYAIFINGALFKEYLIQVEESISRGLKICEKYMSGGDKKDVREDYRASVRRKLLDSAGDFASICLAKELQCPILTKDLGQLAFAEKMGVMTEF